MTQQADQATKLRLLELTTAGGHKLLDPDGKFGLRRRCKAGFGIGAFHIAGCGNRGWGPSDDLWAYVRAAKAAYATPVAPMSLAYLLRLRLEQTLVEWVWDSPQQDPGPACFQAVAKVLL